MAQKITFSEPQREDGRDINFDIIGRMKSNVLVFKNVRYKYAVSVYKLEDMTLKEKIDLDFIPDKTFNVDFIPYSDMFYFIYQYQKKGIVYCMGAKMNAEGHIVGEPFQLDTTHVGSLGDNKIYNTIYSEDKKKIMVFKIQKKDDLFNFATLLMDDSLRELHRSRFTDTKDERNDDYSDFILDNEGNLVFCKSIKKGNRAYVSGLYLFTKANAIDTFQKHEIPLNNMFIDEIKIKADNVNKRYLMNSFCYSEKRGNIDGIFSSIWDASSNSSYGNVFTRLEDSLRSQAKANGSFKTVFNDFFIRNILLKKDGSYLIAAEDFSTQTNNNNFNNGWNRWDYLYGSPFYSPYYYNYNSFNYYSPYGYYRPYSGFGNQSTRYYCDNVLLLDVSKEGTITSGKVITKDQYADDNDNYLSFSTFITGSEIHFLYNVMEKRDKLLTDQTLSSNGTIRRNPTIKSAERGYEFMPKLSRQVSSRQVIIPCTFRNQILFARVDF